MKTLSNLNKLFISFNRISTWPLKTILPILFALTSSVPLLLVGIISLNIMSANIEKEIQNKTKIITSSLSNQIENFFIAPLSIINQIKGIAEEYDIENNRIILNKQINVARNSFEFFNRILLLDNDGKVLITAPDESDMIGNDLSNQPLFNKAHEAGVIYWSPVFISSITGKPTLTASLNFNDGVISAYINLEYLEKLMESVSLENDENVLITDKNGTIISHPNIEIIEQRINISNLELIRKGKNGIEDVLAFTEKRIKYYGSTSIINPFNWILLYQQSYDRTFSLVNDIRNILFAAIFCAITLSIFLAFKISLKTLMPLNRLTSSTKNITNGKYSSFVWKGSYSELNKLAESFLIMIDAVKGREQALQESEKSYRSLVENIPGIVYRSRKDRIGSMLFISNFIENITGYPSAVFVENNFNFLDLIVDEDRKNTEVQKLSAIMNGKSYKIEYRIIDRKGHTHWFHDEGRQSNKEDNYIEGVIIDITEQKKARNEVLKLRNYLSNIIKTMPVKMIGINSDFKVTLWNSAAEIETGISEIEAVGEKLFEIFPRIIILEREIRNSIKTGEILNLNKIKSTLENRQFYENIKVFPVSFSEQNGAVIIIDNVTEQVIMDMRYQHTEKMDSIGNLAAGLAHDLNNLLTPILGCSELLSMDMESKGDNQSLETLSKINGSASKASNLVKQLLTFSRKGENHYKQINIDKTIKEFIKLVKLRINEKVKISLKFSEEIKMINADETQIEQVIMNMCVNASDSMVEGGDIIIETGLCEIQKNMEIENNLQSDKLVKISFIDTGSGIPDEQKKNIFEPFYSTKGDKGTGLGLSTVYGIIKNHGGDITVTSKIDSGTRFDIYLPVEIQKHALLY